MDGKSSYFEEWDLRGLFELFGSEFCLEDIANAYCEAKKDVDLAAQILLASKGATSVPVPKSSHDEVKSEFHGASASLGSVSGVVGRDYVQPKTWTKANREVSKPLKLDAREMPESVVWGENSSPTTAAAKGTVSDGVVDFLYKMLGDGFELDKNKIHVVLGHCGYDVQKTMEELVDESASTLEKYDDPDLAGENVRFLLTNLKYKFILEDKYILYVVAIDSEELFNSTDSSKRDKDRAGLQKEILESLFSFTQISEELPKKRLPARARPYRGPYVRPTKNTTTTITEQPVDVESQIKDESDDENSYKTLRGAVREHWITMKEYYRAAVDAFVKCDYARADRLVEEGNFYNRKAREADEKSAQKLLQSSYESNDEEIPLDLHEHEPNQALHLLKFHLTTISGIHSIKYLRVIVGTEDEDRKGTRKKLVRHTFDISLTNSCDGVGE
uniref:DUF1771 domain-containing protein n=1 Tax=Cajanus cajan TaxID=3821 RepID=A0A151REJ3_CAJCA|nr:hypothetical protein KK1_037665 [Cajanus cajan]